MGKRLGAVQRLEVLCNGVAFLTTAKQVRNGVGRMTSFNTSCQKALEKLESEGIKGIVDTFDQYVIQMDIL